mmetsp:Transcript_88149/g.174950  ORF Transcript_88149/g.174950 Transcript_88149/m.174950 type:complete len:216 (+) Transcript_88149:79-726(+)
MPSPQLHLPPPLLLLPQMVHTLATTMAISTPPLVSLEQIGDAVELPFNHGSVPFKRLVTLACACLALTPSHIATFAKFPCLILLPPSILLSDLTLAEICKIAVKFHEFQSEGMDPSSHSSQPRALFLSCKPEVHQRLNHWTICRETMQAPAPLVVALPPKEWLQGVQYANPDIVAVMWLAGSEAPGLGQSPPRSLALHFLSVDWAPQLQYVRRVF